MVPIIYGRSGHSDAYQRYVLCQKFGWDYYTYEAQPAWFIDEILVIMYQEAQKEKQDQQKLDRAHRRPSTSGSPHGFRA